MQAKHHKQTILLYNRTRGISAEILGSYKCGARGAAQNLVTGHSAVRNAYIYIYIWESGGEVRDGAGKGVLECEMCTE
jgi:hypothetical protein